MPNCYPTPIFISSPRTFRNYLYMICKVGVINQKKIKISISRSALSTLQWDCVLVNTNICSRDLILIFIITLKQLFLWALRRSLSLLSYVHSTGKEQNDKSGWENDIKIKIKEINNNYDRARTLLLIKIPNN